MTDTTAATAAPRPLYRDPNDKVFTGVCAGLGRYTDTDPVIWRVVTGVLTVFGGTGVVLYLLGWLLIPRLGDERSLAEQWLRPRTQRWTPGAVAVVAIVAVLLLGGLDNGRSVGALAVLGAVGYLVHRERTGRPLVPSYAGPVATHEGAGPGPVATAPPAVRRERSRLGALTLSVAILVTAGLLLARRYGVDGLTPARLLAVGVLVVGVGLVVGTWWGRARWLAAVGLVLCLALAVTSASEGALRGGAGDRRWLVGEGTTDRGFRLGVGDATLDLRPLPVEGRHLRLSASVGVGHLLVLVPNGVPVRIHSTVGLGAVTTDGADESGQHVERTASYGPPGDPRVEIEASVRTGEIEVRRG